MSRASAATTAATVSRWSRRYVLTAALAGLAWAATALLDGPRRLEVVLVLFGLVLLTVFGKAYSLVPTYFDRELAVRRAPAIQYPLVVAGLAGISLGALDVGPAWLASAGAAAWALGVAVFLGAQFWTIRTNPTGAETATGSTNEHRRPVDRLANAFVPLALAYLAVGSYETLAAGTGLPTLLDGYPPRATHLLAAGTASILVFALGFRLLPRFLVAPVPRPLVALVLSTGALGPALLAIGLTDRGSLFVLGALAQAVAVVGFAVAYALLFARSDRHRVGTYGVLAGAAGGTVAVALGLWMAFRGTTGAVVLAHLRLNLVGFLGVTIVGVAYQFYPPAIGTFPGASDRTALASIGCVAAGVGLQALGLLAEVAAATTAGEAVALLGLALYAYTLAATFDAR